MQPLPLRLPPKPQRSGCTDVKGMNTPPYVFNGTCNETRARVYRRGYFASVSYSDYNIGVLLSKLDELELAATTAVAVIGQPPRRRCHLAASFWCQRYCCGQATTAGISAITTRGRKLHDHA